MLLGAVLHLIHLACVLAGSGRLLVPVSRRGGRYESFAGLYPLFYRHKVLLPLLPLYRTLRAMGAGRFKAEARAIRDA